mgnify:CR=1 FL=1
MKGVVTMENLERILAMLEHALATKRRRHIAGGLLLSASLLFGGLAVTVITLKYDIDKEKEIENEPRFIE